MGPIATDYELPSLRQEVACHQPPVATVVALGTSFHLRHGLVGIAVALPHLATVTVVTGLRSRKHWKLASLPAVTYPGAWAFTLACAPNAVNQWWDVHRPRIGSDLSGNSEPVEFKTGVPFTADGFEYRPDFEPEGKWWCCVGEPWCDAPFLVASEAAWQNGPFSGFAGKTWFIWTGFGLVPVYTKVMWFS